MAQALAFPHALGVPALGDDVQGYIASINRLPMLEADEEYRLTRRLRDENDLDAAKRLILSHLRLVVKVARGYRGYGLAFADLIQEGNVGLMKAVKRFDPERGARLATAALYWIKAEINEFVLRNWRIVRTVTTKAQRKLFFNLRKLRKSLGALGQKEANEIAAELEVAPSEVRTMEARLYGQDVSFNSTPSSEYGLPAPEDYLASDDNPQGALIALDTAEQQHKQLAEALQALDARSRAIIQARWLQQPRKTLTELGRQFGVSAERIRQLETKILTQLRSAMPAGCDH